MRKKISFLVLFCIFAIIVIVILRSGIVQKESNTADIVNGAAISGVGLGSENSQLKKHSVEQVDDIQEVSDNESDKLTELFYNAKDLHSFVNANLTKAINGDHEVQYFIFKALRECEPWLSHPSFQSKEQFENYMNENKNYSSNPVQKKLLRETYSACSGFVGEDIQKLYKKNSEEWLKESFEGGYSAARTEVTISELVNQSLPVEFQAESSLPKALSNQELINQTLSSVNLSEPESLFVISNSPIDFGVENEVSSAAWMLLSCRSGFPCENNRVTQFFCLSTACDEGADLGELLRNSLSPQQYQTSQRLSKKFEEAITNGDWNKLSPKFKSPEVLH